jgi:DNA polymerase III subunit beta
MKFTVTKEQVLEELQLIQGIVEKRNTMPILANVLIQAGTSEVEMTGTDLEVGLRTHFEAAIEEPGAVTVSGKKLFEIVKSLPDGQPVTFREDKDLMMEITAAESEFRILCLPKEDYPQVPEAKFASRIAVPVNTFQEMIDRVFFAIAQEQRYYLNGALMVLKKKSIELVSTDGHRLSYTSKALDEIDLPKEVRVIVAKKTLSELRKYGEGDVEFDMDENNLFFRCGHRTLISRIIESKFPNFEAVIPKDNPNAAILPLGTFMDAIRRVSLFSSERSRGIKFTLEKNKLRLFSSNPEIGEARDKIDVDYKGVGIEIGFNAQYLLEFLTTIEGDKIRLELKDENSAALLRPEGDGEIKSLYVLMPMKI